MCFSWGLLVIPSLRLNFSVAIKNQNPNIFSYCVMRVVPRWNLNRLRTWAGGEKRPMPHQIQIGGILKAPAIEERADRNPPHNFL